MSNSVKVIYDFQEMLKFISLIESLLPATKHIHDSVEGDDKHLHINNCWAARLAQLKEIHESLNLNDIPVEVKYRVKFEIPLTMANTVYKLQRQVQEHNKCLQ